MSGTFWKTLTGRCVYQSSDIKVCQNFLYRWLMFHDQMHLQTLLHRYHPQKPLLTYLQPFTLALRFQPGPVCLLGLGGGAVAHYVSQKISHAPITAVEAHPTIIQLASEWFMTDHITNLVIQHTSAEDFIAQCTEIYQHILIDIYTAEGFPNTCAHREFFLQCKQSLDASGFLALNLPNISQELLLFNLVREIFSLKTLCIPVPHTSNMIVLATASSDSMQHLLQHTRFKTLIWDNQFGYMARM